MTTATTHARAEQVLAELLKLSHDRAAQRDWRRKAVEYRAALAELDLAAFNVLGLAMTGVQFVFSRTVHHGLSLPAAICRAEEIAAATDPKAELALDDVIAMSSTGLGY